MEFNKPWDLKYWDSTEWEKVNARLCHSSASGVLNPSYHNLFRGIENCQPTEVSVVFVGQDPYPSPTFATGRAFEVPRTVEASNFPPTLKSIFSEYSSDLSLPYPTVGDLSRWVQQGVLLWNAIPSTEKGKSLAHDWREYDPLTLEVLNRAGEGGCVYVFFGAISKRYLSGVREDFNCRTIQVSHPSPRGSINSRSPFRGGHESLVRSIRNSGKSQRKLLTGRYRDRYWYIAPGS